MAKTWRERIQRGLTKEDYDLMCLASTCMVAEAACAVGWVYYNKRLVGDVELKALEFRAIAAVHDVARAGDWPWPGQPRATSRDVERLLDEIYDRVDLIKRGLAQEPARGEPAWKQVLHF